MRGEPFNLARVDNGELTHILLVGEIDIYAAPTFKWLIVDAIQDGQRQIIIDYSEVTFFDSTSFGILVSSLKRLRAHDGRMALVINSGYLLNTFAILGFDKMFDIYSTIKEAEGSFAAGVKQKQS
ncbi:MAG: STAS domain-containing protein [Patescibacteria group bacterium]